MEIKSPSNELIGQALRSKSADLVREGRLREATAVQEDMVTLGKARGDNLYDKHYNATNDKKASWPKYSSIGESYNASPAFLGLEILGAGGVALAVFGGHPIATAVGATVAATVVGVHVLYHVKGKRKKQAGETLEAIARQQTAITSYVPSAAPTPLNIERNAFLQTLQGQEARLVESNQYDKAGQLRRLREGLAPVPGKTVDELFENLIKDSSKKELLDLLQGDCSQQVFEGLNALAEVVKLTNPGARQNLSEGAEAVIVGGVVIKKRS